MLKRVILSKDGIFENELDKGGEWLVEQIKKIPEYQKYKGMKFAPDVESD
jgi:hypothetical protein